MGNLGPSNLFLAFDVYTASHVWLYFTTLIKTSVYSYNRTFVIVAVDHEIVLLSFGMWLWRMRDIYVCKIG